MKKKRFFLVGAIMAQALMAIADQHADDIARALVDRLTCPHDHITLLAHGPLYINLDMEQRQGQVLFNGNKVLLLKARYIDIETAQISIGESIVEMQGNGPWVFYLDKFKKKLYVLDGAGQRDYLADAGLEVRGKVLRVTLRRHEPIWLDVCHRYEKAVLYFKTYPLFRLNMDYFPIRGEAKYNVIRLKGNGPRPMYCNYSRRLLYFRDGEKAQQGRFADLKYESPLTTRH
jgi:hypothetical protein